jgi:hypothetical protein
VRELRDVPLTPTVVLQFAVCPLAASTDFENVTHLILEGARGV